MSIKTAFKAAKTAVSSKGGIILSGVAVAGVGTVAILGVKAGMKIQDTKIRNDYDNLEKEDKREVLIHEIIPDLVPTAVTALVTIGCIAGAQAKDAATIATLAGMYSMKEKEYNEITQKTQEFLGEKKTQALYDKIAEDAVMDDAESFTEELVENSGHGDTIVLDLATGKYFKSDIEYIRQTVNDLNESLIHGDPVRLNDFYYALGLKGNKLGENIGWDCSLGTEKMNVRYSSALLNGNTPIMTIDYDWYGIDSGIFGAYN